jgi:hypothetical protein
MRLWPAEDPDVLTHTHGALDRTHPHLADAVAVEGGLRHAHAFVIDSHHPEWPRPA